jgi:hypothetical protein
MLSSEALESMAPSHMMREWHIILSDRRRRVPYRNPTHATPKLGSQASRAVWARESSIPLTHSGCGPQAMPGGSGLVSGEADATVSAGVGDKAGGGSTVNSVCPSGAGEMPV